MVSIDKIEAGVAKYIDVELAPNIPTDVPNGQLKKLVGVAGAIYAVRHGLRNLAGNKTLSALGAMDEDGNVDVDGLAEVIKEHIPTKGLKVTVPFLSDMALTFHAADVDTLHKYITEG